MSSKPAGPKEPGFPPEIEAIVAHERIVPPQPDVVRSRLLSRAREAVRLGPPAPSPLGLEPPVAGRGLVAGAAGVAVAAGVAAAFYLSADPQPSSPAVAPAASSLAPLVPPPVSPPAQTTSVTAADPSATSSPSAANRAGESAGAPSARAAPSSRGDGRLEELELLTRARQADARGDANAVLAVVAEHERSFSAGRLAEEREVLRVKSLVRLGRGDQARRAGARFRRQFPRSVLLHKVDEMLASLP